MGKYFEYDRVIGEQDFCNFTKEKQLITEYIETKDCVKVYGRRNFGKTSLVKEIVAKKWEEKNLQKRVVVYVDLYSVQTLDDISSELTQAFNSAFAKKETTIKKIMKLVTHLKNIRPVWSPSTDLGVPGDFSFTTDKRESCIPFPLILENINRLAEREEFEFLLIFDEFQEVAQISKAEAKLRNCFQFMEGRTSIVILGSKFHLLRKIFNTPKAPFANWGMTLELGPLPCKEYHEYMLERFKLAEKSISYDVSKYLQVILQHVPEAINRVCDFIARDSSINEITETIIDQKIDEFLELSRSTYSEHFAEFKGNERSLINVIAHQESVSQITSSDIIKKTGIAKSSINNIVDRLLDNSALERLEEDGVLVYRVSDPLFAQFIKKYK